jgi:hypothetical protein
MIVGLAGAVDLVSDPYAAALDHALAVRFACAHGQYGPADVRTAEPEP